MNSEIDELIAAAAAQKIAAEEEAAKANIRHLLNARKRERAALRAQRKGNVNSLWQEPVIPSRIPLPGRF